MIQMEIEKDVKGILKHSSSHAKVNHNHQKQVSIDSNALPTIKISGSTKNLKIKNNKYISFYQCTY